MDAITCALPMMNSTYDEQFNSKLNYVKGTFNSDQIVTHQSTPTEYRNKQRFTIGYNSEYKIVCGYNDPKNKPSIIVSAIGMINVSKKMNDILKFIEDYLQDKFEQISFNKIEMEGPRFINLFGNLTLRTSFNVNESMIIINLNRISNRDTIGMLIEIYKEMYNHCSGIIQSYYILNDEFKLVRGKPYINEKLIDFNTGNNFNFRITEVSFFQTNTYMTNIMYSRIKALMIKYSTDSDILFDLCCGTGTIGIYCASLCKKVIGIDTCETSIIDAIQNAKMNSINNCEFICDKIENVFKTYLDKYKMMNKFIIIDPPRSGLHESMPSLIDSSGCNFVIYVSCNQDTMMRDIKLMPNYEIHDKDMYDMYPFTDHVEVSCVLIRKENIVIEKPFEYVDGIFRENESENYFEELKNEINFKQDYFKEINGGIETMIRERRLTCLQSDVNNELYYSKKIMTPDPFSFRVKYVKDIVETRFGIKFDSCLINYYVNQSDYMGFHKDDVGVTKSTNIITVSFGETRTFVVRLRNDKDIKYNFELKNGDIFRMFNDCQELYDHSIPEVKGGEEKSGRISLTFRVLSNIDKN
jgi:tRNA/tmRNA/rRNA uracil-C5-methylase (TrmA/RlmC/RlmD family)/alkylated DNA repair dioxygenase AlkB